MNQATSVAWLSVVSGIVLACLPVGLSAASATIDREDLFTTSDVGIRIHIREVRTDAHQACRPILLVHGARVPGIASFDLWLYGTLVLAERRSGYVIIFLGSLLGLLVPVIHMKGAGVGGTIAKSSEAFFFIWTLIALGVSALFSLVLSVRGLWEHLPRRKDAQHKQAARA